MISDPDDEIRSRAGIRSKVMDDILAKVPCQVRYAYGAGLVAALMIGLAVAGAP
jgi:hypothetical protein